MKNLFVISMLSFFMFSSCNNNKTKPVTSSKENVVTNNVYLDKYAGGYQVDVNNISSNNDAEVYVLRNDGSAKWMYILNDGNGGAKIQSEKNGNWTASENNITITINGNSGSIIEEFDLKNGEFYDKLTGERKLTLKQ